MPELEILDRKRLTAGVERLTPQDGVEVSETADLCDQKRRSPRALVEWRAPVAILTP